MKIFICCLIAGVFSLAWADVKPVKENAVQKTVEAVASDRSSESKPKRDASHVYHGPSYKYLPPSSIYSYDSYSGNAGNSAGHAGVGGGYSSGVIGRGQNHFGISSSGHHSSGHGIGYGSATGYHGSGHQGLGFTSSSHYAGHGSTQYSGGFKSGVGHHNSVAFGHSDFSVGRPHTYSSGHGYSSSGSGSFGVGYKSPSHSLGGSHANSGSGYYYSKGVGGTNPSPALSGYGTSHGSSSLDEVHHGNHVHNGAQEHVYVVSSAPSGYDNSHGTVAVTHPGRHEVPSGSYIPPVQQLPLPSTSYGVPLTTVGDSYNKQYHSQAQPTSGLEHAPSYAAGHKGLGHFGYTANKPQVLHTSITGTSFKEPSYSKAPFKPSTFLGIKYEGTSQGETPTQQYLPPSAIGSDSTGYDYPIPSAPSINYQEPSYQQSVEVQATDSAYLSPNNNEGTFHEVPSAPSASYLPPSSTYGVPYTS